MNTEKEIQKIKQCITDLVYEKDKLKKAYNYYHLIRDPEQFQHLEDNYGIGTPTSVEFTPLIKKHIDVLVGEYLELDPDMQITCKDENTLSEIMRDKQLAINKECFNLFKSKLENSIIQTIVEGKEVTHDPYFEKEIEKIKKTIDKNFISDYEIAAQNIIEFCKKSRDLDMKNKCRELLTDLLISGTLYYDTKPTPGNKGLGFRPLNPLDTFIERNPNSYYLNKSSRAVSRRYLTVEQIIAEYGDELKKEDITYLKENHPFEESIFDAKIVHSAGPFIIGSKDETPAVLGGLEALPVNSWKEIYNTIDNFITVYECQWIEIDDNNAMQRHEGVLIGKDIYICRGEIEDVPRSVSNPRECTLSINGCFFNDKNGNPLSLVLSTMSLQDKYDLLIYSRDNLIASSGTVGDWIDLAHLPSTLGVDLPDRLQKWLAYKKTGLALFDSSQEGANVLNTTFNGFDDTLKAQAIQAIQIAIDSIEQQASSITGVFAEKLGGIQQRDAVSNVKVGIRQSTLLTKQYFSAMDGIYKEICYDLLNQAKIVYKEGITAELVLGPKLKRIFTALPKYYTMTDFDIHIQDSTEIMKVKETIESASIELIKSGQADASMIIKIAAAKNITELTNYIEQAIADKKAENDMIEQLQQQLQEAQQQLQQDQKQAQQLQEQINKLQKEVEKNNQAKLQIEQKRVQLEEQEIRDKKDYNDKIAKQKERQVDIEFLQLNDGNPYNDKIKDI